MEGAPWGKGGRWERLVFTEWEELSPETTVGLAPWRDSSAWRCLENRLLLVPGTPSPSGVQ